VTMKCNILLSAGNQEKKKIRVLNLWSDRSLVSAGGAQRERRVYSKWLKLTGWEHVTLNAQNLPKLGRLHMWWI
jgi:hypothetical protein